MFGKQDTVGKNKICLQFDLHFLSDKSMKWNITAWHHICTVCIYTMSHFSKAALIKGVSVVPKLVSVLTKGLLSETFKKPKPVLPCV